MATPADHLINPPAECPAPFKAASDLWDSEPKNLLTLHKVPWHIQHEMATEGYTTLADLADRWKNQDDLWDNAAADYKFNSGTNGNTGRTSRRSLVSLKQAVASAGLVQEDRTKVHHRLLDSTAEQIMIPGHRESMEKVYACREGEKPPIQDQGSDHFLGRVYKTVHRGQIPVATNKEIVGEVPDHSVRVTRGQKTSTKTDGTFCNENTEEADLPASWDAWRKQMRIWRTSLLMGIWACPHQSNLQVSKKQLGALYDFIEGPKIALKENPPSLQCVMVAERKAWSNIAIAVHEGNTLSASIDKCIMDTLFWTAEIYQRCRDTKGTGKDSRNRGGFSSADPSTRWKSGRDNKDWWKNRGQPAKGKGKSKWDASGKGKWNTWTPNAYGGGGGGGKKGAGGGKHANGQGGKNGGKNTWGNQKKWASVNSTGTFFCYAWCKGTCPGQCNKIHRCPIIKPDGSTCNGRHTPDHCP